MRRVSVELLRQSPSPALRPCKELASHQPLARELFNAAFVAVWPELTADVEDKVVQAIETALRSPTLPPAILHVLLNLAEFMDHDDSPLRDDLVPLLGKLAEDSHVFAKALHYKELEIRKTPSSDRVEELIKINNKLNQQDAAMGVLKYAERNLVLDISDKWYLELEKWDDALAAYAPTEQEMRQEEQTKELWQETQAAGPQKKQPPKFQIHNYTNVERTLGRMKCYQALGKWPELLQLAKELHKQHQSEILLLKEHIEEAKSSGLGAATAAATAGNGTVFDNSTSRRVDLDQLAQSTVDLPSSVAPQYHQQASGRLTLTPDARRQVESLGAKAAFTLQSWQSLEEFVVNYNESDDSAMSGLGYYSGTELASMGGGGQWTVDQPFYEAVLEVHRENYAKARRLIENARGKIAPRLASLISESYSRAYGSLVKVSQDVGRAACLLSCMLCAGTTVD
jgi:hypothetical protein